MIHYKKTQYGIFISTLFIIIIIGLGYAYWFQIGSKPIPLIVFLILFPLFIIAILLFYKLTICITDSKIEAKFGIGMIKKSMLLSEIDFSTIEKVTIPWYYGIGIRITPKGTLYNVKVGDAILIKNTNKTKVFLVGTNDFETIKNTLDTLKINGF